MRRFFAEEINGTDGIVALCGEEAHHIISVLRMGVGDHVLLINGDGGECVAEITSVADRTVTLSILEHIASSAEPNVKVTLFQCLPKQGKMELIIQKCVELGVSEIVPVASQRCISDGNIKESKLARWNRVSQEAAKQCGRASVPIVTTPVRLKNMDVSGFDIALLAYENETERTLKSLLRMQSGISSVAIIIGPEGGFSPSEVEWLVGSGVVSVSLGRRILRTETAGIAMLAQLMYELED